MIWGVITTAIVFLAVAAVVLAAVIKGRSSHKEEIKQLEDLYKKLAHDYETQKEEIKRQRRLLEEKEKTIERLEQEYQEKLKKIEEQRKQLEEQLEELTGKDKEELLQLLQSQVDAELEEYKAKRINEIKKEIEEEKEKYARRILIEVLQNADPEVIDEVTVSRIKLSDPEIKGKIIGKEGRNIRAFEQETGVDLIIDEEDDYITLSSYDPVRREIAKLALQMLIKDGRIHPSSIERYVKKAKKDVTRQLIEYGKELAQKAGLYRAPRDLLILLGRMKFRRSNGQSLYRHTAEVIKLSEELARMLKADVKSVKLGALLHDVGKLLTAKISKPHHHISADIAKRYGFNEKVINIIEAHHDDIPARYIECEILKIADKISTLRPGARKDTIVEYVDRIKALEEKASEVAGDKAEEIFALKAGRQLRVIVKPHKVSDEEATILAYDIAKAIEESGVFPGEVEVVVIREVRSYAKAGKPVHS